MARRTQGLITKEYLKEAPLPALTKSYTPISHGFIIDKTLDTLMSRGFEIESEHYRCNLNAEIASGKYNIKFEGDSEMGMMFTWVNSYNKMLKFSCAVGGRMYVNDSNIISNKMSSFSRKHTGTADIEAAKEIESQIDSAHMYYAQLVEDKRAMKGIILTKRVMAELTGRLHIEKRLITAEQLSIIKSEILKPSFVELAANPNSLWTYYNYVILSLQKSHPKTWMDQQRLSHWFICEEFGIDPMSMINTINEPIQELEAPIVIPEEDLKPGDQMRIENIPGVIEEPIIVPLMSAQLGTIDMSKPEEGFIPNGDLPILIEAKEMTIKEVVSEYGDHLNEKQLEEVKELVEAKGILVETISEEFIPVVTESSLTIEQVGEMVKELVINPKPEPKEVVVTLVDSLPRLIKKEATESLVEAIYKDAAERYDNTLGKLNDDFTEEMTIKEEVVMTSPMQEWDGKKLSAYEFNELVDKYDLLLSNGDNDRIYIGLKGRDEYEGEVNVVNGEVVYTHYKRLG